MSVQILADGQAPSAPRMVRPYSHRHRVGRPQLHCRHLCVCDSKVQSCCAVHIVAAIVAAEGDKQATSLATVTTMSDNAGACAQTHYEVLQVPPTAALRDIRLQFQRLCLIHHPDKSANGDSTMFIRLRAAYETLADPTSRARYDAELQQQRVSSHGQYDLSDFEYNEEVDAFLMACRCSGQLVIYCADMDHGVDIAACAQCSTRVRVLYEIAG